MHLFRSMRAFYIEAILEIDTPLRNFSATEVKALRLEVSTPDPNRPINYAESQSFEWVVGRTKVEGDIKNPEGKCARDEKYPAIYTPRERKVLNDLFLCDERQSWAVSPFVPFSQWAAPGQHYTDIDNGSWDNCRSEVEDVAAIVHTGTEEDIIKMLNDPKWVRDFMVPEGNDFFYQPLPFALAKSNQKKEWPHCYYRDNQMQTGVMIHDIWNKTAEKETVSCEKLDTMCGNKVFWLDQDYLKSPTSVPVYPRGEKPAFTKEEGGVTYVAFLALSQVLAESDEITVYDYPSGTDIVTPIYPANMSHSQWAAAGRFPYATQALNSFFKDDDEAKDPAVLEALTPVHCFDQIVDCHVPAFSCKKFTDAGIHIFRYAALGGDFLNERRAAYVRLTEHMASIKGTPAFNTIRVKYHNMQLMTPCLQNPDWAAKGEKIFAVNNSAFLKPFSLEDFIGTEFFEQYGVSSSLAHVGFHAAGKSLKCDERVKVVHPSIYGIDREQHKLCVISTFPDTAVPWPIVTEYLKHIGARSRSGEGGLMAGAEAWALTSGPAHRHLSLGFY